MLYDLMVSSLPETPSNTKFIGKIAERIVDKTVFTKGTGFFTLTGFIILIGLFFFGAFGLIDKQTVTVALFIVIGVWLFGASVFLLPEIIQRIKKSLKNSRDFD